MAERVESNDDSVPGLSELSDVSNVLLLVPSLQSHGRGACLDLLTRTSPEKTNVLAVTYTQTVQEWIDQWTGTVGTSPARGGVVSIGQSAPETNDPAWAATGIDNPSDLTGIGIEFSELLSQIGTAAGEDEHIAVCFNSVTSLLQYADLQRTFRFLHVLTGRIKTVDGVGHFHLDPDAHDDQTLATLKGLFDAVIEVNEDGSWEIQQ